MTDIPIMFDHVSDSFCVKDGDQWLYFDSVSKAKDAVRQVKMKEAVKAERDRIVAWLRAENGRCDCFAHEESECACGGWNDYKQWPLNHTADLIEAGGYLK